MPSLSVALISAALGFCGVIYELVFAQAFSVLFGQSVVQYSVTIGLFLGGMGLGSHLSEHLKNPVRSLSLSQFLLALCTPILFIFTWWLGLAGWNLCSQIVGYATCIAVGAMTGAELPLLLRLSSLKASKVLAADYFGMLLACLAFPLVLLPSIGVFATLLWCAVLNASVLIYVHSRPRAWVWLPMILIATLFIEPEIREWLSQKLIFG